LGKLEGSSRRGFGWQRVVAESSNSRAYRAGHILCCVLESLSMGRHPL